MDFDRIVTPMLLHRFMAEAELDGGDGRYCGVVLRDGETFVHHPGSPSLRVEKLLWARDALCALNREIAHGGAWVIAFTHSKPVSVIDGVKIGSDYTRYVILWLDADGDVQIPIEWVENETDMLDFADVVAAGNESLCDRAESAWQIWRTLMLDVLDLGEGQTYRRALGERPSSKN